MASIADLDASFQDWFPDEVKMVVSVRKEGERVVSVPIFGEKSEGFTDNDKNDNGENGGNEGNGGNTDENDNNEAYNDDRIRYITKLLFY